MAVYANLKQRDKARSTSKRFEVVNGETSATALKTAIDGITGGSVKEVSVTTEVSQSAGYGTGVLGRESVFLFQTSAGKILPLRLRGVEDDYLVATGRPEIDVSNEDIVAFAAAVIGNVKLSDGETPATLVSAYVTD